VKEDSSAELPRVAQQQNLRQTWETYIRKPLEADIGDEAVPERETLTGKFGLLPHWAQDEKFARRTFNARSETAATLPSFRDA